MAIDVIGPDDAAKMFKIYLMENAHARWDDTNVPVTILCPFDEPVALRIALVFQCHIPLEGIGPAAEVDID